MKDQLTIYQLNLKRNRIKKQWCLENFLGISPNKLSMVNYQNDLRIACPAFEEHQIGVFQLYLVNNQQTLCSVQAHATELVCITMTRDASTIATASKCGTLINVFSGDGTKLYALRRGVAYANIKSLIFSSDYKWLASTSSNRDTIHIYKLDKTTNTEQNSSSWSKYCFDSKKAVAQMTGLNSWVLKRAFATVTTQNSDADTMVGSIYRTIGFVKNRNGDYGLIVSKDWNCINLFQIDSILGAECKKLSDYQL